LTRIGALRRPPEDDGCRGSAEAAQQLGEEFDGPVRERAAPRAAGALQRRVGRYPRDARSAGAGTRELHGEVDEQICVAP